MGTLYIVATPIGNKEDISLRAIETLKSVDYILCENIRTSKRFLANFEIDTYLETYKDETRHRIIPKAIYDLKNDANIALISDNGTPLISDPGFKIVEQARQQEIPVVPIPGPSAITAALSVSGLPTDKFAFLGFLPKKGGQRLSFIENYGKLDCTLVFYESPHRIGRLVSDIKSILGDRRAVLIREMTKVYEQAYDSTLSDLETLLKEQKLKGEIVLLVAKEGF